MDLQCNHTTERPAKVEKSYHPLFIGWWLGAFFGFVVLKFPWRLVPVNVGLQRCLSNLVRRVPGLLEALDLQIE